MMVSNLNGIKKIWNKSNLLTRVWVGGLLLLFFLAQVRSFLGNNGDAGVRMIVAKRRLEPGLVVSLHDLTVQLTSQDKLLELSGYSDSDIHEVLGKKIIKPIKKGEVVSSKSIDFPENYKFTTRIPKGTRAFSTITSQQNPLEPGDRVDLLAQFASDFGGDGLFLENKKVLAVRNQDQGQQVLVALHPEEISQIQSQKKLISWEIVLRNPYDDSLEKMKPKRSGRASSKKPIQILSEVSL